MKKLKNLGALILIVLTASLLFGCYDQNEIDETAYVIALGIDKGENNNFLYTLQFSVPLTGLGSNPTEGGGNADSTGSETKNLSVSAPDFYIAKNLANNFLSKNVNMSHLKIIVFSEEVDADGFAAHSQFLLKEREIRPHTAVSISKSSAKEYISGVNPDKEQSTAKYYELLGSRRNNIYAPSKRLSDLVDEMNKPYGASAIPIAHSAANTSSIKPQINNDFNLWLGTDSANILSPHSELSGMAILREGVLCGTMDGDKAMIYNILSHEIQSCLVSLKSPMDESKNLNFRLLVPKQAEYKVKASRGACEIAVIQDLRLEFLGNTLPKGFSNYDELYALLTQALTHKYKEFFFDSSKVKNADIMHIGDCYKKAFLTQEDWEKMNWANLYKKAKFDILINFV